MTGNEQTTLSLGITRQWAVGDVIVIDGKQRKVFVNNSEVSYVGRIPFLYKTNQLSISDDATSRTMNVAITYNKRYL